MVESFSYDDLSVHDRELSQWGQNLPLGILTQSADEIVKYVLKQVEKDLSQLPCIFLLDEGFSSLPPVSGLYIVTDTDCYPILYVGKSINLRNRIRSHNRKKAWVEACEYYTPRIMWIEISDLSLLDSAEQALIEYFDPPLNTIGRPLRRTTVERNNCVQKTDEDLYTTSPIHSLYCNGFPIAWLYTNKLTEVQIKKILNSYENINWQALEQC